MIQKCNTGHVGIEDSADGSAMLRSTSLVITVALDDTGRTAKIIKYNCAQHCNICTFIAKTTDGLKLYCAHFQMLCRAVLAPACMRADVFSAGSWNPGNRRQPSG